MFTSPCHVKSFAADADAVAQRAAVALNQIEMALGGDDDDGARRFVGAIEHRRLPEFRIEFDGVVGDKSRLVADIGLRFCAWLCEAERIRPPAAINIQIRCRNFVIAKLSSLARRPT